MIPVGTTLLLHRTPEAFEAQLTHQLAHRTPSGSSTRVSKGFGVSPDLDRAIELALEDLAAAVQADRDDARRSLPAFTPAPSTRATPSRSTRPRRPASGASLTDLMKDLGL